MFIYCDYCVYHYKSTEIVSLYTLDIGLKIYIIIITFCINMSYMNCYPLHVLQQERRHQ